MNVKHVLHERPHLLTNSRSDIEWLEIGQTGPWQRTFRHQLRRTTIHRTVSQIIPGEPQSPSDEIFGSPLD